MFVRERRQEDDHIEDIYDGNAYKEFLSTLTQQDRHNYVTTILNTDGAPKFKSSQYSIWPIYLMLNELHIHIRMNNLVTCGLWCHRSKPEMNVFLDPLVDIINNLSGEGIPCVIEEEERTIKLHVISCCVDSSARAPIQGIKQYNGYYGCSWCLHPGEHIEGSVRYPLQENIPALRDNVVTVEQMLNLNPGNPVDGILNASALINLKSFKIVTSFVPDYLHCCLEGVAK